MGLCFHLNSKCGQSSCIGLSTPANYDLPPALMGVILSAVDTFCNCVLFRILGTSQRLYKC